MGRVCAMMRAAMAKLHALILVMSGTVPLSAIIKIPISACGIVAPRYVRVQNYFTSAIPVDVYHSREFVMDVSTVKIHLMKWHVIFMPLI